jgi:hypothetical protein
MERVIFTVSIEIEEDEINSKLMAEMLSAMEEVVGRSPFCLDDSSWEVE